MVVKLSTNICFLIIFFTKKTATENGLILVHIESQLRKKKRHKKALFFRDLDTVFGHG